MFLLEKFENPDQNKLLYYLGFFYYINSNQTKSSLFQACKRGNTDIVRLLLEYGADCNIQSKHKNTALYFAKVSNNLVVFDLVKEHINV